LIALLHAEQKTKTAIQLTVGIPVIT